MMVVNDNKEIGNGNRDSFQNKFIAIDSSSQTDCFFVTENRKSIWYTNCTKILAITRLSITYVTIRSSWLRL